MRPAIIRSTDLKKTDLPPVNANWAQISSFALTYDPREMGSYGIKAGTLSNASPASSIIELRAHLYVEQRRWNHFVSPISDEVILNLRSLLEWMRGKLV